MLHLLLVLLLRGLPDLLEVRCFMLCCCELLLLVRLLNLLLLEELLLLSGCSGMVELLELMLELSLLRRGLGGPLLLRLLMDAAGGSLGEAIRLRRLAARDAVGWGGELLELLGLQLLLMLQLL